MLPRLIKLDPVQLNTVRTKNVGGEYISVMASPYDLPGGISGRYDDSKDMSVIRLHYVAEDEPLVVGEDCDQIRLLVGENSRRLYRIEIAADALKSGELRVLPDKISKAIDHLASSARVTRRVENYRIVKQVVEKHAGELFAKASE